MKLIAPRKAFVFHVGTGTDVAKLTSALRQNGIFIEGLSAFGCRSG
jgi:hypothetical protein